MFRFQPLIAASAVVLGVVALVPPASANDLNQKMTVTFDKAIEVTPDVTLQPGTYVFKLRDPESENHVMIIENKRETHTYATVFALNQYRPITTAKAQFIFGEAPNGAPAPLREMFYPGRHYGNEFIYPHQ